MSQRLLVTQEKAVQLVQEIEGILSTITAMDDVVSISLKCYGNVKSVVPVQVVIIALRRSQLKKK